MTRTARIRIDGKLMPTEFDTLTKEESQKLVYGVLSEDQIARFEKEILTQAEEVYNLLLFSFQEGGITGIELIEARRTLIEARRSYSDALYIYNMTLAGLERSVGEPLGGDENE